MFSPGTNPSACAVRRLTTCPLSWNADMQSVFYQQFYIQIIICSDLYLRTAHNLSCIILKRIGNPLDE